MDAKGAETDPLVILMVSAVSAPTGDPGGDRGGQYLAEPDSASMQQQIGPFAEFLAQRIHWSVEQARR
jgi:hypothetical protein